MSKQTIDTYKLTSLEEPSDEILSQLMKEVAEEPKTYGSGKTSVTSNVRLKVLW